MQPIILFYLENCPYCWNAKCAIEALYAEKPAYREVPIEWVEESRARERAARYDYYYVPSAYCGERKLFETRPGDGYERIKADLDAAFGTALSEE